MQKNRHEEVGPKSRRKMRRTLFMASSIVAAPLEIAPESGYAEVMPVNPTANSAVVRGPEA
jgi:hypothetical protein